MSPMSGPRDKLTPEELAMALSNYDLGIIRSAKDLERGAHGAAKIVVESDRGSYLLKRRIKGRDDPQHVAFTHALQHYLLEHNFPLPQLVHTRSGQDALLRIRDGVYELFEYISADEHDNGIIAAYEAGRMLGLYHRLVGDFPEDPPEEKGNYHNAPHVLRSFKTVGEKLVAAGEQPASRVVGVLRDLRETYKSSATTVEKFGLPTWETQIIHCDWHPGNMLFEKGHVVAVLDFDSARLGQRVIDVANGVLQFSFINGGRDLSKWTDAADDLRARRFLRGYDSLVTLSEAELRTVPFLMQEALIAQAIGPILRSGTYAGLDALGFLEVVLRKVRWIAGNAASLHLHDEE